MFSDVGDTALVLLVPQAEPLVRRWRIEYDSSAEEGMPAHITVLYPFAQEANISPIDIKNLEEICTNTRPISLNINRIGRWTDVLWLDPESEDCVALLKTVRESWTEFPPYGQNDLAAIPHLTITDIADQVDMAHAESDVAKGLPLYVTITALSLMIFDGISWKVVREFQFLGPHRSLGPTTEQS